MPTPDAVAAHMGFIESVLANFARAVNYDARNGTDTHETVHLQLTKTNPELVKELAYLLEDRMRLLEATLGKRKGSDLSTGAATKKSKKAPSTSPKPNTHPSKPHDSSVLHLMAKHEGKSICLRHLSVYHRSRSESKSQIISRRSGEACPPSTLFGVKWTSDV
jgi:hypothetical protein